MTGSRKGYAPEFELRAVTRVAEKTLPVAEVARPEVERHPNNSPGALRHPDAVTCA